MSSKTRWASNSSKNEQLIEALEAMYIQLEFLGLSTWEKSFITSVYEQKKSGKMLSLKQYNVLDNIDRKYRG